MCKTAANQEQCSTQRWYLAGNMNLEEMIMPLHPQYPARSRAALGSSPH